MAPESDWTLIGWILAQEAMGKFTIEKDIAQHIKRTVRFKRIEYTRHDID
jgi:hypothetical protein